MAKQLLETIKEAEIKAEQALAASRAEADALVSRQKAACEQLEQERAKQIEARAQLTVSQARTAAASAREDTLANYTAQADKLKADAGARLPDAAAFIVRSVIGA